MRIVAYTGLALGLAGAALDFVSGYMLAPMTAGTAMKSGTSLASTVLLYSLGFALITTGLLLVLPRFSGNMQSFGLLMEAFGVVMALASTFIPGMSAALSDSMLIVGALMILNGAVMQRGTKGGMKPAPEAQAK